MNRPCLWSIVNIQRIFWMRSSLVVRASDCQCTSCNGPGFDPSIRRHSGIWGAADEAVLNIVRMFRETSEEDELVYDALLQQWFTLVNQKNALLRRQMQLNILEKEDDLEKKSLLLQVSDKLSSTFSRRRTTSRRSPCSCRWVTSSAQHSREGGRSGEEFPALAGEWQAQLNILEKEDDLEKKSLLLQVSDKLNSTFSRIRTVPRMYALFFHRLSISWNTSSLRKNSQGRYIWSYPHFFAE